MLEPARQAFGIDASAWYDGSTLCADRVPRDG
jgi:hypothetical protein